MNTAAEVTESILTDGASEHRPVAQPNGQENTRHWEKLVGLMAGAMGMVLLYLSSTGISLEHQFLFGWTAVALVVILKSSRWTQRPMGRIFLLVLVSFISLRYFIWRTFDTLIYTGPLDFVAMALVYLAEMQVSLVHFLNMFVNLLPLQRPIVPLPDDPAALPTVDIFIPTYNEPEDLVEVTALACTQIQYPKDKLKIFILDDGGTLQRRNDPVLGAAAWRRYQILNDLAASLGIGYITRDRNEKAKAGNINAALERTTGDLILILDCDHVPCRDILQNTVGWFARDPKLFLVQTPHFFINPNPIEKNLGVNRHFPAEHEMFYRANQPALDLWNSAIFCGSAGVLRRKCLDEVGGVSSRTITEDAETALALHARGYSSAYIARPMICGLSTETFTDFITQRTRWCQGMLQTAIFDHPLLMRGTTFPQRICYLSCFLFWVFGLSRFIFFIAPTLFILFGLKVYDASLWQIAAFALPHLVAALVSSDFLFGKYRWPLFSDLYEGVQSIFLMPAILRVINNPSKLNFKVTPKGKPIEANFRSPLAAPFLVLVAVLVASVPVAVYKWFEYPMYRDVLALCGSWLAINLLVASASLGAFLERPQGRHHHRVLRAGGTLALRKGGHSITATLADLSLTGMRVKVPHPPPITAGDSIVAELFDSSGGTLTIDAQVVRSEASGDCVELGVVFDDYRSHLPALVNLVYGDSQVLVDWWERSQRRPRMIDLVAQFLAFARNGVRQVFLSASLYQAA